VKRNKPEFSKGELVFIKKHVKEDKLDDEYIGPFEVLERRGLNNYVIKKEGTKEIVHVKDLKRYRGEPEKKEEETPGGNWREVDPDPNMKPEELLERHVFVW